MSDKNQSENKHRRETDTDASAHASDTNRLLDRRDYLKLTGTTAAAAAAGFGGAGTAAAESYDTVTVGKNETKKYNLGDNDTLENILFDITAPGARVKIRPVGSGWVVRNIGFKGRLDLNSSGPKWYMIGPEVSKGGTGLIENVYLGDGATNDGGTGIFVPLNHAGTLTIRRCYFQHWADNGVYGSAPGRDPRNPGYGTVQIEQCYARNNNLSNFRVGTDGSYVRDSVIHVDDDVPYAYGDPGAVNSRGIWAKEGGNITVDNCDILLEHPDGSACVWEGDNDRTGLAKVRNSQIDARGSSVQRFTGNVDVGPNVGQNPDVGVPAGVPQSAKQAAQGSGGSHLLEITGSGTHTDYSFTVDSNLKGAGSLENTDNIVNNNQSASGAVGGGTDAYTFDGNLRAFNFNGGQVNVLLDGKPAHVGQRPDHFLQIEGQGTPTPYSFNVSNNLEGAGNLQDNDNIVNHGWSASGEVGGGTDSYTFDGDLVSFDFDGEVNVLLDGQPAQVGQRPDHLLQIEGTGNSVDYDFTVSSNLEKTTAGGGSINSSDNITNQGQSASGGVSGGTDAYTFDGDLRAFDFNGGEINVLLDGGPAHVGQLPDKV
ncbi:hypothetical protein [Haladaptatus cibarius]|uniref:hypothetical protein n=1 Tax=Haladaptatus cibarius TaxID=453847 RepID=UPI0006786355|nr:hypothetical protein [Haladaptatus cibarius]